MDERQYREEIQEKFNKIVKHSQELSTVNTDSLFHDWYENKKKFIDIFGGITYEYPEKVHWKLSETEKKKEFESFIKINSYYETDFYNFLKSLTPDEFFENKLRKDYIAYDGEIHIPANSKIIKDFKYFLHGEELKKIQDKASVSIQKNKIFGTFCISVNPIDYLSSSENAHNWRSCHSLDGEYRAGNLSYMTDSCTAMCYLKADGEFELPNFPEDVKWNSKKWRMLLYFSDDMKLVFSGRQYPFAAEESLPFIQDVLVGFNLFYEDFSDEYVSSIGDRILYDRYFPVGRSLVAMNDIVKDTNEEYPLQYNDILRSTIYTPSYAENVVRRTYGDSYGGDKNKSILHVGHDVNCVRCGKKKVFMTDSFMCDECELNYGSTINDIIHECEWCGRRFWADDAYWVNGTGEEVEICPHCYEQNAEVCSNCGEVYCLDDIVYDEDDTPYCRWCYEDVREEDE